MYNKKAEKDDNTCKKNNLIKREIPITNGPIETKAVFFCGKFSTMRHHV